MEVNYIDANNSSSDLKLMKAEFDLLTDKKGVSLVLVVPITKKYLRWQDIH